MHYIIAHVILTLTTVFTLHGCYSNYLIPINHLEQCRAHHEVRKVLFLLSNFVRFTLRGGNTCFCT